MQFSMSCCRPRTEPDRLSRRARPGHAAHVPALAPTTQPAQPGAVASSRNERRRGWNAGRSEPRAERATPSDSDAEEEGDGGEEESSCACAGTRARKTGACRSVRPQRWRRWTSCHDGCGGVQAESTRSRRGGGKAGAEVSWRRHCAILGWRTFSVLLQGVRLDDL